MALRYGRPTCWMASPLGRRMGAKVTRAAIEAWEAPLLNGRDAALAAARQALGVAAYLRTVRSYGWRPVAADRIAEAGLLRRAVAVGRLGQRVVDVAPLTVPVRHYLSATAKWDGEHVGSTRQLTFCGDLVVYPRTPNEYDAYVIANYGPPKLVSCAACIRAYQQYRPERALWDEDELDLMDKRKCSWQTAYGMPGMEYCESPLGARDPYCREHMADLKEQERSFWVALHSGDDHGA